MSQVGAGSQVFYGVVSGTPPPTTEIANVTDIQFPEIDAADVKNTNYQTANATHDYIAGYTEGGELTIVKDFAKADETSLRGIFKVRKLWKVTVGAPEAGDWQFQGYVSKIGPGLPLDEKLTQKLTIKVCTLPVWTPGA